jgi:YD repeat-containing protein
LTQKIRQPAQADRYEQSRHQYTYNALNRLDLLIDHSPTNTIINCWKYHTTGAGQRTWVEEFDKRTAWYTYDNLGRLKTETVTGSIQDGENRQRT